MKLAIYSTIDGSLSAVYENINNPKLEEDLLIFDGGSFSDLTDRYILLDDDVEPPETVDAAKTLDQKSKYTVEKVDELSQIKDENTHLKSRLEVAEMAIISLMDFI